MVIFYCTFWLNSNTVIKVGQTVEVLMRLTYDGRKVRYPRANRKTMRSKRLHANRKQSYVLQCEDIHAYT